MMIDSAAEPKTKPAAGVAAAVSEKENDVAITVTRKSRKRSRSAAISSSGAVGVVTPPRPSSSAAIGTALSSAVKRSNEDTCLDDADFLLEQIADELSSLSAISHRSSRPLIPNVNANANESHGMIQQQQSRNVNANANASPPSQVASSPPSASPPLVDLKQDSDDSEEQVVGDDQQPQPRDDGNEIARDDSATATMRRELVYRGAQRLKKVRENMPQALSTRTPVCKDDFVYDSNPESTTATKMILKVPTNSEMGVYGSFLLSIDERLNATCAYAITIIGACGSVDTKLIPLSEMVVYCQTNGLDKFVPFFESVDKQIEFANEMVKLVPAFMAVVQQGTPDPDRNIMMPVLQEFFQGLGGENDEYKPTRLPMGFTKDSQIKSVSSTMVTASIYLPNGKMDIVCNQMYHDQSSNDQDRQVCQRMRQMISTRVSGNITCMLDFPRQPFSVRAAALDLLLGRQPTIRCSKGEHYNNECCVDDCNDHLCVPWGRYCMHHRDPKTRCRHCNRGLADGSEIQLCSICNECHVIDCKEPRTGTIYCQHHSDPKTRCRKCNRGLVEGNGILCSTCNLLCRTSGCENRLADGSKLCSDCNLGVDGIPHPHDVICGRGKHWQHHPGNRWYRQLVRNNEARYLRCANNSADRRRIAEEIVNAIRHEQDPPGRFLTPFLSTKTTTTTTTGEGTTTTTTPSAPEPRWHTMTNQRAFQKTAQALVEMKSDQQQPCNSNKKCCVEECKDRRHSPESGTMYCQHHSDPKTRCRKCNRGLVEGSEIKLCSTCNLLCRTKNCMNQLAEGSATKLCSLCLVEAEAIAKEKRLEGEARKLKKEVIEKEKRLERDARKLKKEASNQGNGECFIDDCKEPKFFCGKKKSPYCKKHRDRNTRCRRCNVKGIEKGGRTIFCSNCNEIIRNNFSI